MSGHWTSLTCLKLVLGSSKFFLLTLQPLKMRFISKVVKNDSKNNHCRHHQSDFVTHSLFLPLEMLNCCEIAKSRIRIEKFDKFMFLLLSQINFFNEEQQQQVFGLFCCFDYFLKSPLKVYLLIPTNEHFGLIVTQPFLCIIDKLLYE